MADTKKPETGNVLVTRRTGLAGRCGERIVTGAMACRVDEGKHAVAVDVLVGGFQKSFTLQPLSMSGQQGVNLALGIANVVLWVPKAQ